MGSRTLSTPSDATGVTPERHGFLVRLHVLKELDGALKLPPGDLVSRLTAVLEGDAEVGPPGPGGLGLGDGFCGVSLGEGSVMAEVEWKYRVGEAG